jgi:NAD(P)-dependent dehydrogenase (short-subunit alcohol dehydrogenase family)
LLRATLSVLRAQRGGHVLQGSSYYGQVAHPGVGLVSATKYAVEGLTDALYAELEPLGIAVTLVEPGPTATAFLARLDVADTIDDYDGRCGRCRRRSVSCRPTPSTPPTASRRPSLPWSTSIGPRCGWSPEAPP